MVLFINSCPRKMGISRTLGLCDFFIEEYKKRNPGEVIEEVSLYEKPIRCLSYEEIQGREESRDGNDACGVVIEMARQFACAKKVIIGAPYWDLSFPAALKAYIEMICVNGITFKYTAKGSLGLSSCEKMMYITTAGGYIGQNKHGSDYLRAICGFLSNGEFCEFSAEGLDIVTNDPAKIIEAAKEKLKAIAQKF